MTTKLQFREDLLTNPNLVVNCRSEKEATELLTWADSKGRTWGNGESYLEDNKWGYNKTDTCYFIYGGTHSIKSFFEEENTSYIVLPYNEALAIVDRSQDEFQFQGHCHNLMSTGFLPPSFQDAEGLELEKIVRRSTGVTDTYDVYARATPSVKSISLDFSFSDNPPLVIKSIHTPKLNFG